MIHAIERFEMLRKLGANHGGEGELAPDQASVDRAIAFLRTAYAAGLSEDTPVMSTFGADGIAILEFENRAKRYFASIGFPEENCVDCYERNERWSTQFEAKQNSEEVAHFMVNVAKHMSTRRR